MACWRLLCQAGLNVCTLFHKSLDYPFLDFAMAQRPCSRRGVLPIWWHPNDWPLLASTGEAVQYLGITIDERTLKLIAAPANSPCEVMSALPTCQHVLPPSGNLVPYTSHQRISLPMRSPALPRRCCVTAEPFGFGINIGAKTMQQAGEPKEPVPNLSLPDHSPALPTSVQHCTLWHRVLNIT